MAGPALSWPPPPLTARAKDKDIREKLVKTGHVDVMVSVGNNFFYTQEPALFPVVLRQGKKEELRDKVLFIGCPKLLHRGGPLP